MTEMGVRRNEIKARGKRALSQFLVIGENVHLKDWVERMELPDKDAFPMKGAPCRHIFGSNAKIDDQSNMYFCKMHISAINRSIIILLSIY
ncbi:hypothetical protein NPIL_81861 [Nephila pilipes]|uniref:Uncharacterized protein n=1 Tax=Nephila pilipes TaxID=299642 RepID=A0A8X6NMI6_NEPPI|nr:hypothetical protein NPIL_81861 [Nephila pilipes]